MALIRDHSAGGFAVRVPCLACGKMVRLADTVIDTEGPAFKAYYHDACHERASEATCAKWDCRYLASCPHG